MRTVTLATLVVLLGTLLLAACAPAATPMPTAQPEGCLGTAEDALVDLDCRSFTVAVENAYQPFNYISPKTGQGAGWDYDAINAICTRLHCTPVFVEAAWETMIQAVADGQYDVAGDGITITEDRAKIVDFSDGYISIEQRLLVRKGESRFDSIESFIAQPDLIMGTQANTTNYETAKGLLPESRLKAFETFPFAVQALISQDVDTVIIDEVAGMGYMGENADKLGFVGPSISSDALGFAFTKGSTLVGPFNRAIAAMKEDGTMDALNLKFFGPGFIPE